MFTCLAIYTHSAQYTYIYAKNSICTFCFLPRSNTTPSAVAKPRCHSDICDGRGNGRNTDDQERGIRADATDAAAVKEKWVWTLKLMLTDFDQQSNITAIILYYSVYLQNICNQIILRITKGKLKFWIHFPFQGTTRTSGGQKKTGRGEKVQTAQFMLFPNSFFTW